MARIHAHRKGKSHSIRPMQVSAPWISNMSKEEITNLIVSMAKDGFKPSEIGLRLRDEYGIPLVKKVIGKSITEVLEDHGIKTLPEDLSNMLEKAIRLQKHLNVHRSDSNNIRSLELIEAKIHRLAKYYKREGKIPQDWKYKTVIASLE